MFDSRIQSFNTGERKRERKKKKTVIGHDSEEV
jgi:hypothetical protein